MPIEVELPDGNTVEFPDGTDNATMERALRAYAFNSGASKADFTGVQGGVRLDGRGATPRSAPKAVRPATYNLTGLPGVSTQVGGFLDAVQHRVLDVPHGIAQLLQHGVKAGTDLLPEGNAVRDYVSRTVAQDDKAMREREAAYQARTRGNMTSNVGAGVGMLAGAAAPVGALRAAGALPRVTATGAKGAAIKGGLLAGEGAFYGAATPALSDDFAGEKSRQVAIGAVTAPALAAGLNVTGAGARAVRQGARYVTPKGREKLANERVSQLLGADDATLQALRAETAVPGYSLTPAQALATPEAVQAERILRNNGLTAPAFAAQESTNNAALRSAVASVAKDDDALQAAIQARRDAIGPYRTNSLPEEGSPLVDPAPVVATLERLAKSANATVRSAASEHLGMIRAQAVDGKVSAFLLDDIRQEAGGMLAKHSTHGAVGSKVTAKYAPVTAQIADTLDASVPGYRDYLATYARASQPINDMEAGRALLGAIDSGGRDAGGNQIVGLAPVKAMLARDNRANFPMSEEARA